ncbi:MAG: FAD-dependent oxidoreductase [Lachnospiraceae bacterium]|nr:FAD-dependent oxidoreductase [Lachnospiraceae bacterium]
MIRINQLKSDHELNTEELYKKAAKALNVRPGALSELKILKKSVDARHKNAILHIYSVTVKTANEDALLKRNKSGQVSKYEEKIYSLPKKREYREDILSPVITGFGPAGMFAALYLAYAGLKPIVIERGEDADSRTEKVREFWKSGRLNLNSNVQFGEGGAGTFSDGKLQTGVHDKENRNEFVLKSFVKYGAPESILTDSKPHIGSDILREIVKNIRQDIIDHGGQVRFNTCFTGFETDNDGLLSSIILNGKEKLPCEKLILAPGHSARDTFEMLNNSRVKMEPKSFAMGVRVQHRQDDINRAMYGDDSDIGTPASYKLTFHAPDGRGVYSFCMCPGGYVVNSSSEDKSLCINGMSYSGREGKNANSAIVVTVTPDDFTEEYGEYGVLSGMEFQRELERKAFSACNGLIPCQTFEDFKNNRISASFGEIEPEFRGSCGFSNIREILPDYISGDIISAFESFGKKIRGFDRGDALLSAVESRTSSPVRILRNEYFLSSVPGIFPAGEGAGYAGGIMSAAIDGLKCAEALCSCLSA